MQGTLEEVFQAARAWITYRTLDSGTMTTAENNAAHDRFNNLRMNLFECMICDHCQQGTPAAFLHETPDFNDGLTCSFCVEDLARVSAEEAAAPLEIAAPVLESYSLDENGERLQCVCSDCGNLSPVWFESPETKQPDHCGCWADCPDCGHTGVQFCPCDTENGLEDYALQLKHFGESYQPTQEEVLEVLREEEQARFDRLSLAFFNQPTPKCSCNQCLQNVPQWCFFKKTEGGA